MWKGRARIELNFHIKDVIDRFLRVAVVVALAASLLSPWIAQEAKAIPPFYNAANTNAFNDLCALSITNTNQDPLDYHTTIDSRYDGNYCYLRFTTESKTATFTNYMWLPAGVTSFDYLIVGGGGGGGIGRSCANEAGGGGAGGLRTGTYTNSSSQKVTLVIGGGGVSNTDGSPSYIQASNGSDITRASGGGHGGTCISNGTDGLGANGGSGGGGTHDKRSGGNGNSGGYTPSEGNSGGTPTQGSRGGGGGGWATAGANEGAGGTGFVDTGTVYWPEQTNIAFYKLAYGGAGVVPGSNIGNTSVTPGGVSYGASSLGSVNGGDAVQDTGSGGGGSYSSSVESPTVVPGKPGGQGADGVIFIKYRPSTTDGLNLICVPDSGQDSISVRSVQTAANSTTSDAIFPYPGDTNFYADYGQAGPRNCGTISGSTSDRWTEFLSGYVKAPVTSSSSNKLFLVALGDDGLVLDAGDDSNAALHNVLKRVYDDGAKVRVFGVSADTNDKTDPMTDISRYVNWTAGKWYPIRIWHHENGGGALFTLKYTQINPTSAADLNSATLTNFLRTNFSARRPVEATLKYTGSTTMAAGTTFSPTYSVTSVDSADTDGAKTWSTTTPDICSVNSSGVVTSITQGNCVVNLATAATATFVPARFTATIRIAFTPNLETDTAINFNANSRIARNTNWSLLPSLVPADQGAFTVEAWINATAPGTIFQAGIPPDDTNALSGFRILIDSPAISPVLKVYYTGFGGAAISCDREIQYNRWTHIAIGIRLATSGSGNSRVQCSIDGFMVADKTPSSPQNATISSGVYIGNNSALTGSANAQIDEVKVWNSLRTTAQIKTDSRESTSPTAQDLLAYYDFNEGSGNTVYNRKAGALDTSDLSLVSISSSNWLPVASASVGPTGAEAFTLWQFTRTYITSTGGWKVPAGVTRVHALVVGGGGGGGSAAGGGGGAGAIYETVQTVSGYETITVGTGGASHKIGLAYHADSGLDSVFDTIRTIGGGGGGSATSGLKSGYQGGSGGGAAYSTSSGSVGTVTSGGYGLGSSGGSATSSGGGGGGGANGAGASASTSAGVGGSGYLSSITGTNACYATGGGGSTSGGSSSTNGGTCSGFTNPNLNAGTAYYLLSTWISPNTGAGGGAAGTSGDSQGTESRGQSGSAGIIIIRYITATKPIYTIPAAVDTTTAGKAYQFTIGGTPVNPLKRSYTWQWTNGTSNTWVNYTTTDTVTLNLSSPETMTSGANYSYRVVVKDYDVLGMSITDTSTGFYLIINPRNTITSSTGSNTLSYKYGDSFTATFTFANGTGTRTPAYASTTANQAGSITWSGASSNSITLNVPAGLWAGTYVETLTVTDSVSAFTTQAVTIILGKADTVTVTTSLSSSSKGYDLLSGPTATGSITGLKASDAPVAVATSCRTGGTCKVGDVAPGGGYVFYVSATVIDTATGISSGGVYLATAPVENWTVSSFCNTGSGISVTTGYGQGIGSGANNTLLASPSCSTGTAVNSAVNLSITDAVTNEVVNDWFTPSQDELLAAMKFHVSLSPSLTLPLKDGYNTYYYWSSFVQNFGQTNTIIYPNYTVIAGSFTNPNAYNFVGIPIRAFSATKTTTTYTALNCASGGICAVGDAAPGGGYVFKVFDYLMDSATGISDGGIYLASAPVNQIKKATWCNKDLGALGWGNGYGAGAYNTKLLADNCSSIDAGPAVAALWDINGYDDWFLPSQLESSLMYSTLIGNNKVSLASVSGTDFWTSSLATANRAYYSQFQSPSGLGDSTSSLARTNQNNYWPVRAFSPTFVNSYSPPTDAGVYDVSYAPVFNSAVNTSNYQAIVYNKASYTITRAAPPAMVIPLYGGVVGTPLYFSVYGGNGNGPLFRSIVTPGTSACTYDTVTVTISATAVGPCIVRTVHGGNKNVFTDTLTATVFWMTFLPDVVTTNSGGSHSIPISDGNQFETRTVVVTSTSFTDTSNVGISSASKGTRIRILVTGYDGLTASDLTVYFKPYEDAVINEVTATYVDVTIPSSAITGKIAIDGPRGVSYSPIFTVNP